MQGLALTGAFDETKKIFVPNGTLKDFANLFKQKSLKKKFKTHPVGLIAVGSFHDLVVQIIINDFLPRRQHCR